MIAKTTTLPGKQATRYQSDELGFVYVVIQGNTMTASFYDATGARQYTHTVIK